jgi:hypothetical protein
MNAGPGFGAGVSASELAALVMAVPRPPMVTAHGVLPGGDSQAAMLAWGRHAPTRTWFAGVSFVYNVFRGGPIRALITIWLPATQVGRRRGEMYGKVPRVVLVGAEPEQWPSLPPVYPNASHEWIEAHHHAARVDPARRYGLKPTPARRAPRDPDR